MIAVSQRDQKSLAFLVQDRPAEAFEQLDSALRVVSPRNWLALSVVFGTIAAFLIFSILYRAPLKVDGRGIILARTVGEDDPLLQVTAPAAGRISRVDVKIGATVKKDETLGLIDQGDLNDQIKEATAEVRRLEDEDRELSRLDENAARSKADALDKLEFTLKHNLSLDEQRLTINRQISGADAVLKKRGFLNNSDALKTRADADAVESSIGATQAKLQEVVFDRTEDGTRREGEKLKRTLGIRAAKTKLDLLKDRYSRDTRISSPFPFDGSVIDLMITPHAMVEKGAPVALLRPLSRDERPMEAIVFVPAGMGKKIHVGHPVEIAPDTVRRHEHGFINGTVKSVSEIPATEMAMLAELKHKTLVTSFVERYRGQVLLSIHVDLSKNAGPPQRSDIIVNNHMKWSSASGASQYVTNGTLCGAEIVVERRPLIALAMPWVKQLFGFD